MTNREMGIEEARAKLGDLVRDAQQHGIATAITRNGKPGAVLMPPAPLPEKHEDPEMREALVKGLARHILRGRMHTKRPDYSPAQILATARHDLSEAAAYGYTFPDDEAGRIAVDANALADKVQDTNPNWDQWAQGY